MVHNDFLELTRCSIQGGALTKSGENSETLTIQ